MRPVTWSRSVLPSWTTSASASSAPSPSSVAKRLKKPVADLVAHVARPRNNRLPPKAKKATRRRRKRRGGTRADQAVKLIKDNPGITASEIAKQMKIKPNYLYRVLSDLEKQKKVKKKGRTYTRCLQRR